MSGVLCARGFSNGMHRKSWRANVDGLNPKFGGSDWPNRCPTSHIRACHEFLIRNIVGLAQVSEPSMRVAAGRIALVSVNFDHRSVIENRPMLGVMLGGIIWVYAMRVIGRYQYGMSHRS